MPPATATPRQPRRDSRAAPVGSNWDGEDDDNYWFLTDAEKLLGVEIVRLSHSDGLGVWGTIFQWCRVGPLNSSFTPFLRHNIGVNITPNSFSKAGSQRWLQVTVNRAPNLLLDALRPTLQLDLTANIEWFSPLESDNFEEYRDREALDKLGLDQLEKRELADFWPKGGPVWDALGRTSDGQIIFVEAKAHIGELASPPTRATSLASLSLIKQSLEEAQGFFAPQSQADWSQTFYQYSNRLAHHYLFRHLNDLPSHMVFLYFTNATEMNGPQSEAEWRGAIEKVHSALGLTPTNLPGVHEIFMDVSSLSGLT